MENSITILGANGTKGTVGGTSAFYINKHHVIDAGNLLCPLEEEVAKIETIWLTHSHLDHILDIAYVLDSYFSIRTKTLIIAALPETIKALREHFFNDIIWPDFEKIDLLDGRQKALGYREIKFKEQYRLDEHYSIEAFPTDHTVPSCGYKITADEQSVLVTADTYSVEHVIEMIAEDKQIVSLVIECSFPSAMRKLAKESKHLTPESLFSSLKPLEGKGLNLYINHIKPIYRKKISEEIGRYKGVWNPKILKDCDKIHF